MPPRSSRGQRPPLRLAFCAAGLAAAILSSGAAIAQEVGGLRGLPDEEELAGIGARRSRIGEEAPVPPSPPYRPASPGALPETAPEESPSIFDEESEPADIFQSAPEPSTYTPTTARARAKAANDAASARPASAAERQQVEAEALEAGVNLEAKDGLPAQEADAFDQELLEAAGRDNERAEAIEGRFIPAAENPYAPLGMRAGRFIVTGTLEQGLTGTTNADYSPNPRSAVLSETTLRLNAVSDWSRHSATIDAYGTHRESLSGASVSETEMGLDAALRLDLAGGYGALATFAYRRGPEDATSPIEIPGIIGEPIRQAFAGSVGVTRELGRLRLGVTGNVERLVYGDADLAMGGTLSQEDRNSTLVSGTVRVGYELSPALIPFAEAEYGRRIYDLRLDSAGYERSADRIAARGGLAFDITEKWNGEVSAGYVRESFDDDRLVPVEGPSLRAAVNWSPQRGTVVRLNADTTVEGATDAGESGSILYSGRFGVERELRANLTGNAALGYGWRDYFGTAETEQYLSAEAGLTWWLNRYAGLSGRVRHERFKSSLAGRDYDVSSVFLGVKLQR